MLAESFPRIFGSANAHASGAEAGDLVDHGNLQCLYKSSIPEKMELKTKDMILARECLPRLGFFAGDIRERSRSVSRRDK